MAIDLTRTRVFLALTLLFAVLAVVLTALNARHGFWSREDGDMPVYLRAAERMQRGAEIYREDDARAFTYPPFLALAAVPGTWLPASARRPVWYCLTLLCLAGAVGLVDALLRRLYPRWATSSRLRKTAFWFAMFLLCFRLTGAVLANQSNDLMIVFCVLMGLWAAVCGGEAAAGAWPGVGAAIKATPLLFGPVFVWQRRWRAAIAMGVAVVVLTFLPDLVYPRTDGRVWVAAWRTNALSRVKPGAPARGVWKPTGILNQSLSGTLYRLSTPVEDDGHMSRDVALWNPDRSLLRALIFAAQGLVVAAVAFATAPRWSRAFAADERSRQRWGEAGVVVCGMVLLSPMSSKSHFSILIVPASFLMAELLFRRFRRGALVTLLAMALLGTFTSKGFLGSDLGNRVLALGAVTWAAAAALIGSTCLLVLRSREAS